MHVHIHMGRCKSARYRIAAALINDRLVYDSMRPLLHLTIGFVQHKSIAHHEISFVIEHVTKHDAGRWCFMKCVFGCVRSPMRAL